METKRALERRLSSIEGFAEPRVDLEQYATPADVAAHVVHRADLEDDLAGRTVVDLGCGTGVFALGCAFRQPSRVVGVEVDPAALAVARENERRLEPPVSVDWLLGDVERLPCCPSEPVTAITNPPFGAQRGNVHADRAFLAAASEIARVSYSIHNEGSLAFVDAFAGENGGEISHAFEVSFELPRQFAFHERERVVVQAELFRIEW